MAHGVGLPEQLTLGDGVAVDPRHDLRQGFDQRPDRRQLRRHLPEEIPVLLAAATGGADMILGTRDHLYAQMSSLRRASNRLSSRAISLVAGQPLAE
ncbi:MAG: hypothetical protein V3T72_13195 [Thermoanaerobaculia bacterium]